MEIASVKIDAERAAPNPFRWHRALATAFTALFLIYAAYASWTNFAAPVGVDFVSFWAAAVLTVHGDAASAYNAVAHHAVEATTGPLRGLLPFPYPPLFLIFVAPFGLVPFPIAFLLWLLVTAAFYSKAAAGWMEGRYIFANPAALPNALIGQTGFLIAGIFMLGTKQLERRPFTGGAILGLMAIKPQLALLLPVALIAGREWRAIAGGLVAGVAGLVLSLILFGPAAYAGFLAILPGQASLIVNHKIPWVELASVFATARFLGVPHEAAFALQGLAAIGAGGITWWAWREKVPERVPILAAATLLVPPYLFTYDTLLLALPIGWLIRCRRAPRMVALIFLLCALPFVAYTRIYPGPNTIPFAAALSLWVLCRTARAPRSTIPMTA